MNLESPLKDKVILVVDDETDMLRLLARIITEETAYEVVAESDPLKALERFQRAPFELVITDLKMPKMDGIRVLEAVKTISPQVSVVLRHDYVRVFIEEDFVFADKILSEIEKVLKPCYRKIARIFANYVVIILVSITLITLLVMTWKFTGGVLRPVLMTVFLLLYAALSIFNYKIEKVYSTIVLKER